MKFTEFREIKKRPDGTGYIVRKRRSAETDKEKARFLKVFEECGGKPTYAMKISGVPWHSVKNWRTFDEQFKIAYDAIREQAVEQGRDKTREAVEDMIDRRVTAIVAKAMDKLPEFEPSTTHKIQGTVDHRHYNLTPEEALELFENAKAAIELDRQQDGSFK